MDHKLLLFGVFFCIAIPLPAFILHDSDNYDEGETYPTTDREVSVDDSRDIISDDDYNERMSEIFDTSKDLDTDDTENLSACSNIICVPYYLCIDNMIVTNGTDLLEWRISSQPNRQSNGKNMPCNDLELPCCADNISTAIQIPANRSTSEGLPFIEEQKNAGGMVGQCGYQFHQTRKLIKRAIHGIDTAPMEFPWMAGVFARTLNGKLQYIGGGSIIHKNVILSAAHFLTSRKPTELLVRAGVHDILGALDEGEYQQRTVSRLIVHDALYVPGLINDIALIIVEEPFKWSRFVNPICLPTQSQYISTRSNCMASGWGKDARFGTYQRQLKKIDLSIVERKACQRFLRATRLGPFYQIDYSLLCAGGLSRDTCKGDGGSPLVCEMQQTKNRFYQCGIVAGGIGCGRRIPALYVNVAYFTNWIKQQMIFFNLHSLAGDMF